MKRKVLTLIIPVVLVATGVFIADRFMDLNSIQAGEVQNEKQISKVVDSIKKHLVLPVDEQPLVATVSNAENLKLANSFYENASDGDYLVLYESIRLGILYDNEKDILLKVAPLSLGDENQEEEKEDPVNEIVEKISLDIRNTTEIKGLATKVKDSLSDNETYLVAEVGNSGGKGQTKNIVVVLNESLLEEQYLLLAEELDADILFTLPEEESKSTSDIVVLLGQSMEE